MNNSEIKSMITSTIKPNGKGEITGQSLQDVLIAMVNVLGDGYAYMGDATPLTDPDTPDNKVFYLAIEAGTYTNFDNIIKRLKADMNANIDGGEVHPFTSRFAAECAGAYMNCDIIVAKATNCGVLYRPT